MKGEESRSGMKNFITFGWQPIWIFQRRAPRVMQKFFMKNVQFLNMGSAALPFDGRVKGDLSKFLISWREVWKKNITSRPSKAKHSLSRLNCSEEKESLAQPSTFYGDTFGKKADIME